MSTSDYTPTVAQVGALLRARTQDGNGNEVGTFTTDTRPTGEQVAELIDSAVGKVRARFGETLHADLVADATSLATLRAALLVELSFFPEQVGTQDSAYGRLKELYDDDLAQFVLDFERIGPDGESGTGDDERAGMAVGAFPADAGGLVGWRTVF